MSWSFDGTNDCLSSAVNLSGSPLLTLSCWIYWDAFANDDDLAFEYGTVNYAANNGFIVDPNNNYPANTFGVGFWTNNNVWYYFNRPSAAAWHHLMICIDKNTSTAADKIKAWVDGTAQTMTIQENSGASGGTMGNTTLFAMCRANASLFGAGDMAELALWSGSLLDTSHALMMAKGYSPMLLGMKPTHYWPLIGNNTTEPNLRGGTAMSVSGATKAAHPLVRYPAPPMVRRFKRAAAAIGGLRTGGNLSRHRIGLLTGARL